MEIPDILVNQLISNPVFKTDTRAIFFLLQNPEPVSSDDIATASRRWAIVSSAGQKRT
ncbi:MAG: hypothetical protein WCR46_16455 [Deltaproteobacteria bacterium]